MADQPDHSGVFIPPPFFYVVPLGIGVLIHRFHPITLMPREIAVLLGMPLPWSRSGPRSSPSP